jgi:CheY-like chemotaxis protein/anti-sigma regulatory factor (Ser/Thr protein kinase)
MMSGRIAKLKQLVGDLLEVSRITRGKIALQTAPTDLGKVVRSAIEEASEGIRTRRQRIRVELPDAISVTGDAVRLEQVVENLIENASKYTPEGGHITVRLHRESGDAVLCVEDDGAGLDPRDVERIFEPFVQSDPTSGGLGVGLALVKRLVELHGGTIGVVSDGPQKGSRFTVRLPIAEIESGSAAPRSAGSSPRRIRASSRILIIDDSREAADSLALLLRMRGGDVRCAYSGTTGIEALQSWRPQIALVDIGLPDMTGYDVARAARGALGDDVCLLAVTGYGGSDVTAEAETAGFDEHLVKPIDQDRLSQILRERLEGS